MSAHLLSVEKLTVAAGARTLCRDLDLGVQPGELWAVLGCNGSGKSTLLHVLAGLLPARGGRVVIAGKPLAAYRRRELARTLAMLLQHEPREFWGTLAEYVMLGRHPYARLTPGADAGDRQSVAHAIAAFDLDALAARRCATLSGGEYQRARLAQLWAQQARVMLLDEPLQHLDLRHQLQVMQRLREALSDGQRAALLVLHDLTYAARCDRVLMLYGDGRHAVGTAAELLSAGRLEELYGCRVRAVGTGTDAVFMPVI